MDINHIPYVSILLAMSVINIFLAGYVYYRRRNKTGAIAYIGLSLAISFYSLGYALEITSASLAGILFYLKIEYIGISFFPALWLILVFEYTGRDRYLKKSILAALLVIPVLTFVIHYTNGIHHLFYRNVDFQMHGVFSIATLTKGPWYWVNLAYMYGSLLYGNFLLIQSYRKLTAPYRPQIATLIAGSLLPLSGNVIYSLGYSPWGIDLSPILIALSSPFYAWGLFHLQLLDLIPIARDKVVEGLGQGVIVLDEQNRIADFNPAAQQIFPELTTRTMGKSIQEVIPHHELLAKILADQLEFELKITIQNELQYFYARLSPVLDKRQLVLGKTIVLSNVTQKSLLLEKLRTLATMDETTQIYNRRYFIQLSDRQLNAARQNCTSVSAILMDLDYFKQVNDRYGHAAGDKVLYEIAQICKNSLHSDQLFGRYGGEEFGIFLMNTTAQASVEVAEQLCQTIAATIVPFDNHSISITASLGVAVTSATELTNLDQLLRQADEAMYQAKAAGRNRVVLYSPGKGLTF